MTAAPRDQPVTEGDLLAYVDDRLDLARRDEVEAWLVLNPAAALRVAADLAIMAGLRALFEGDEPPPPVRKRSKDYNFLA